MGNNCCSNSPVEEEKNITFVDDKDKAGGENLNPL